MVEGGHCSLISNGQKKIFIYRRRVEVGPERLTDVTLGD